MNVSNDSFSDTKQFHSSDANLDEIPAWCVAYVIMALAIVAGNVLSIIVFTQRKLSRKMNTYFLVNLSVADVMVGALAIPLFVSLLFVSRDATLVSSDLRALQLVYTTVDVFAGMASVFTLNAVALERYYAVSYPMKFRSSSKKLYSKGVCIIWGVATALSVIFILTSVGLIPRYVFVYSLTITSMSSLLITCVANAAIWIQVKLWTRQQRNSVCERHERSLANTLLLITVVFILTWCPFHVMNILGNFQANALADVPMIVIYFGKLMHYGNSFANPVIYSFRIPEFKAAIKRAFYGKRVRETRL